MGVDVDEPGGHDEAGRVDDGVGLVGDLWAHGDDPVAVDGDIGGTRRCAGAVDQEAAADEEVDHAPFASSSSRSRRAMTLSIGRPVARRSAFSRNRSQIRCWYQGLPVDPEMWALTMVFGASQNGSSGGIG